MGKIKYRANSNIKLKTIEYTYNSKANYILLFLILLVMIDFAGAFGSSGSPINVVIFLTFFSLYLLGFGMLYSYNYPLIEKRIMNLKNRERGFSYSQFNNHTSKLYPTKEKNKSTNFIEGLTDEDLKTLDFINGKQ